MLETSAREEGQERKVSKGMRSSQSHGGKAVQGRGHGASACMKGPGLDPALQNQQEKKEDNTDGKKRKSRIQLTGLHRWVLASGPQVCMFTLGKL